MPCGNFIKLNRSKEEQKLIHWHDKGGNFDTCVISFINLWGLYARILFFPQCNNPIAAWISEGVVVSWLCKLFHFKTVLYLFQSKHVYYLWCEWIKLPYVNNPVLVCLDIQEACPTHIHKIRWLSVEVENKYATSYFCFCLCKHVELYTSSLT